MSFIKENIFIVLGVSLPLLLIALLSLFQTLSKVSVDPPMYKAAYIVMNNPYGQKLITNIDQKTKHLNISVKIPDKSYNNNVATNTTLYVYGEKTGLQTYSLDTINVTDKNKGTTFNLPLPSEVKKLKFINNTTSPDGYRFERSAYRSGNLMTEIFGYNRHTRKDSITKNGVRTSLPNTSRWPETHFVGWVEK